VSPTSDSRIKSEMAAAYGSHKVIQFNQIK
jgi:hypothetical protein